MSVVLGYVVYLTPQIVTYMTPVAVLVGVMVTFGLMASGSQLVALKGELGPLVPRYPGLQMPVELVHGDADRTVGLDIHSRPLARQVPGAGLTVLPGIGHMLHQVATRACAERIATAERRGKSAGR